MAGTHRAGAGHGTSGTTINVPVVANLALVHDGNGVEHEHLQRRHALVRLVLPYSVDGHAQYPHQFVLALCADGRLAYEYGVYEPLGASSWDYGIDFNCSLDWTVN